VIIDKKIAFEIKTTARSEDVKRYQTLAKKIGLEQSYLVSHNFTALEGTISPVFI
jgi:hypothetical protein